MRLGWAGKVALGAAVPAVVGLGGLAFWTHREARQLSLRVLEQDQLVAAKTLAHGLRGIDLRAPDLARRIDGLGAAIGARVTVILADGRVVADSSVADVATMENHAQRPEVRAARAEGSGMSRRFSHTVRRELLYAAARIPESRAVARVGRDVSAVEERLGAPTRSFGWVAGGVVVLGLVAAVLFARGLTRPLVELTEAAQRVEAGDLAARVYPHGGDEVARLGHAFNRMTRQLQESLRNAQAETSRLSTILEGMTEGVVAVDREERISFLNGAARGILALDPYKLIEGTRFYELVREPSILGLVQMAATRGQPVESEIRHEGPPRRMIQVYAAPVGGAARGVILVLRDMSRLRRLEKMRSDFVSNVSHELRTPLASIAAALETLEDETARCDPETGPRFLAMIRRNLDRLELLLSDILALSRLESRPETLPKDTVDLAAVVRASTGELMERARRGAITMRVDAPARCPVIGDTATLRRVVDNLVLNAITYTPAGGSVDVRVGASRDHAVLQVTDTGIGIPEDEIERIFERFYRVDRARSRSAGGTGLGLAIVKHAVGLHGGTIAVQSRPGKGSTFTVRIPLASEITGARRAKGDEEQ